MSIRIRILLTIIILEVLSTTGFIVDAVFHFSPIITALVVFAAGILLGIGVTFDIVKPLKVIIGIVNNTASFNLTHDETYNKIKTRKDETGLIAKAVSAMRKSLRDMISLIAESSDNIMDNARAVERMTDQLKIQMENTLSTTQHLSAGMQQSAATTQEINATAQEIEDVVNSMAVRASEGTAASDEIRKRANDLRENAVAASKDANDILMNVKQQLQNAIEQSKSVSQIEILAQVILQITEQTNLLSLNAAIEAARAGESGKGFGVVAEEIRKLAEQSSKTAADIKDIVKTVNTSVTNLKDSSNIILDFIDKSVLEDYQKLIKTGEQYYSDAASFNTIMNEFSVTAKQLNESIASIVIAINEISSTVNEGAKGVADITEKTSEIAGRIDEVRVSTEKNIESSEKLEELISSFKL